MRIQYLLIVIASLVFTNGASGATYELTFNGTWGPADIDSAYPASAHFSPLIGATHQSSNAFWKSGAIASDGVKQVAELGGVSILRDELSAARSAGTTGNTVVFSNMFGLPNSQTLQFEVDFDKPYISLISMIAPSPDWFVGVSGLSLLEDGNWVESLSVDLRPYDAGTEEGIGFSLSNATTSPREPITTLSGADSPFVGGPVLGSLVFRLLDPPPLPPVPSDRPASLAAVYSLLMGN